MKSSNFVSRNSFEVSGRIVKDATTNDSRNFARFTVAHNFGKDMAPLFVDVVMFAKNGKKDVEIPFDLLKKGKAVIVSGYMRPNVYKNEQTGKTYRSIDNVGLSIQAIASDPQEESIEAPAEEQAQPEAPAAEAAPAPAAKKAGKGSRKSSK